MEFVKNYTIQKLTSKMLGKNVRFTSDCELFHNFNVKVKVISISYAQNTEILFKCIVLCSRKQITIGSNMRNLQFEIC